MHDLYPFPTSMPDGWIGDLMDLVKGTSTAPLKTKVNFAYHVGGFAANTLLPEGGGLGVNVPMRSISAPPAAPASALGDLPEAKELTYEQAVEKLEDLHKEGLGAAPSQPKAAIPWNIVLPILLALLKKFLGI